MASAINGRWMCVSTEGFPEYLAAMGKTKSESQRRNDKGVLSTRWSELSGATDHDR